MKLETLAAKRGLRVEERGPGHFQILGGNCLVNYYPNSKKRSAYIAGAESRARRGVTPQEAIEMAFEPDPRPKKPVADASLDDPAKRTPQAWAALNGLWKWAWKKSDREIAA